MSKDLYQALVNFNLNYVMIIDFVEIYQFSKVLSYLFLMNGKTRKIQYHYELM